MTIYEFNCNKSLQLILLFWLALAGSGCSGDHFVEGQVIDYKTRKPVPGVKIILQQSGWKFTGGVTWDHTYTFESVSDSQGHFRVVYNVGSSAKLQAEKEGYVIFRGWFEPNSTTILKLKSKNPSYIQPEFGMMRLGIQGFQPFGWIFSEKRITFNADEADVFPQFDSGFDRNHFGIFVAGRGGLQFTSEETLGVRFNHLVYTDMAPDGDYARSSRLNFNQKTAGVFYVRTRDGEHFAKFLFNPRSYGTEGSERDYKEGNWALMLEYVFNPKASRNLQFEKSY